MEDLVLLLLFYMVPFLALLAVGGFAADYIFPHIAPLERWINTLPVMQDDKED